MRIQDIRWCSFERSAVPRALFGNAAGGVGTQRLKDALDLGRGIALGYLEEQQPSYSPPLVIILEDRVAAETFSWLKTFAPETSPLSQFARVVLRSDWEMFSTERRPSSGDAARADRWACVVLGELLAQGDNDFEIARLPLAWSASCFSTAFAQSMILHSESANRACIERLMTLEKDQRFARRQIGIAVLQPVWALASSPPEVLQPPDIVDLVVSAVLHDAEGTPVSIQLKQLIHPQSDFVSDSVERRVVAFRRLVTQLDERYAEGVPPPAGQAILAAGAFLVGRGTSHVFLLTRLPKRWSQAFIWFGLMAGLAGPQSWDGEWSRTGKSIERSLKGRLDWSATSSIDISWPEYFWLANTFTGEQAFSDLPKMTAKVLSIEVLPGSACQLRLATYPRGSSKNSLRGERTEDDRIERELTQILDQVAVLAIRARHLLAEPSPVVQESLEFGNRPEGSKPAASPSRRSKR